jgi:uncharacterized protein (TIGR03086 family)
MTMISESVMLSELAAEFPGYEFSTQRTWEGVSLIAVRQDGSDRPGVCVVITPDLDEMRRALLENIRLEDERPLGEDGGMTSDADTVAVLERALDQTAGLIAAIDASQAELATPCVGWDVRALVSHLTGQALRNFLVSVRGETTDWTAPAEEVGDDWAETFRERAAPLRAAWQAADLDRPVAGPGGEAPLRFRADHQITELAVHDWDLARATGQQAGLDPAVAEHALRWSRQMLRPEFRGADKAFGLEVPVPDDAPAYDRLAGWFGRDPGWMPGGS